MKIGYQAHKSNAGILGRRTLERDHRHLAGLLRPGHFVLDVGCGTGAITAGIAKAVGPGGKVIGIDRNEELLALARTEHGGIPNLRFEACDALSLSYRGQFDIVTAARVLQWIGEPASAISKMKQAAKANGMIVVLDYNHAKNEWVPDPPPAFRRFYAAFLDWRHANHWDNLMADHLPELFRAAGLNDVESQSSDEFAQQSPLWPEVIGDVGARLAEAGLFTAAQSREALECYDAWIVTDMKKQTLALRTVTGIAP